MVLQAHDSWQKLGKVIWEPHYVRRYYMVESERDGPLYLLDLWVEMAECEEARFMFVLNSFDEVYSLLAANSTRDVVISMVLPADRSTPDNERFARVSTAWKGTDISGVPLTVVELSDGRRIRCAEDHEPEGPYADMRCIFSNGRLV